jgi:hypothetical protein
VYLYDRGTTDQVTVYKTDTDGGDETYTQPVITNADGTLPGFVEPGRYDAKASGDPDTTHIEAGVVGSTILTGSAGGDLRGDFPNPTVKTPLTLQPSGAAVVPLTLKGAADQTAAVLRLQNSSGNTLFSLAPVVGGGTAGAMQLGMEHKTDYAATTIDPADTMDAYNRSTGDCYYGVQFGGNLPGQTGGGGKSVFNALIPAWLDATDPGPGAVVNPRENTSGLQIKAMAPNDGVRGLAITHQGNDYALSMSVQDPADSGSGLSPGTGAPVYISDFSADHGVVYDRAAAPAAGKAGIAIREQNSIGPFLGLLLTGPSGNAHLNTDGTSLFTPSIAPTAADTAVMQLWGTVGGSAANYAALRIDPTFNGSGSDPTAIRLNPTFTPSASVPAQGIRATPLFNPGTGVTINPADAFHASPQTGSGAGAVTNLVGFQANSPNLGSLKPANAKGINVKNQGAAGVAGAYGINVEAQSGATANTGIAVAQPTAGQAIWLTGDDGGAAGGITFGAAGDVKLFRKASDFLLCSKAIGSKLTSAPADGSLAAGEMAIWFDSTNGAAKLKVKAKQADGTVKTGEVALA